jgi:membrane protein DedA with SNARE-associated domain
LLLKTIADALIAFGPMGVFLAGFADSMGVPLPAVIDFYLLSVAITTPQMGYFAALMALIGSAGGNYILFHAARYGGNRLMKSEAPESSKREKFRLWFSRYGLMTVFIPAVVPFLPLPLKVFVISAGAMKTPASRFIGVIVAARVIRYFGMVLLAIRLGKDAHGFLMHNAWNMAAVLLTMGFALVLAMKWLDRRRTEAEATSLQ